MRLEAAMGWWSARRLRDDELDRELRDHLARQIADYTAGGMSRAEAERRARIALGGVDQVKESCRDVRRWRRIEDFATDVRYALRTLRKNPAFATAAILCLGLGMGAGTAIFALVDAALVRTLPVREPAELAIVRSRSTAGRGGSFSYPQFVHLREHASGVAGMLAYASFDPNVSTADAADLPAGLLVSDNYFSLLGVEPAIGRTFAPSDDAVAVVSHRFWTTRFNADPGVVGRAITVNGQPFTIIGVAPRRFFGLEKGRSPDLFVPLTMSDRVRPNPARLARRNLFWLTVVARLRPDAVVGQVAEELTALQRQDTEAHAAGMAAGLRNLLRDSRISFVRAAKGVSGVGEQYRSPLLVLTVTVALVLLIACANVASLLLIRGHARSRETAVRIALGAGRGRLLRQALTESLVLSSAGAIVGIVIASWAVHALTSLLVNRVLDVTIDLRVLLVTLAATGTTALLCGGMPALRASRADLTPAFRADAGPDTRRRRFRAGNAIVAGQAAVCVLLLIAAGLFARTLANLRGLDAGFRAEQVVLATMDPSLNRYSADRADQFFAELVRRVSNLPSVQSVSLADASLLSWAYVDGLSVPGAGQTGASSRMVGPGFFETMGIPLRAGRDFSVQDRAGAPMVAIVNEAIARTYFGGASPIGRHIGFGSSSTLEIVGVIADTKYGTLRDDVPHTVYLPLAQAGSAGQRTLHVKVAGDPRQAAAALGAEIASLDRGLPVTIKTFSSLLDENLAQERLVASLSGLFGILALVLTSIGVYGVIAYSVQRRTREIGIRVSLGATIRSVRIMVLWRSVMLVAAGALAGVTASVWLVRFVEGQLFGINPVDPLSIATAVAALLAIALAAAYLPARRASRIDPVLALKE
jgi:predicted permease